MLYKVTTILSTILLCGYISTFAQDARSIVQPKIAISGNEIGQPAENTDVFTSAPVSFGKHNSGGLIWTVNNITDTQSGYDLQSNGSTQQLWYDLNNPGFVHSTFTYSAVDDNVWADRTCLYFGSTDFGTTWFELGGVPVNTGTSGRSGFPSIVGTSTGAAVISNHNNADQTATRSTIFIDNGPFEYNFTNHDPGATPNNQGEAIWPMLAINSDDDIVLASSINGGDSFYVNTLSNGVFSGWLPENGDQAETHSLNFSNGGKVGLAWIGGIGNDGNVYYKESTDNGLTWSTPVTVFTAIPDPVVPGDIYGPIRGVCVSFVDEAPVVVFEAGWQTNTGNYYPGREADIRFWSPNINGGVPKVIADSNNVSYFPNYGVADVMWHINRPVIGRSQLPGYLFVAFAATTGEYWPGASAADSTAFMCGMFLYSSDGGETWSDPEQFTPVSTPSLDFRHVSITPVAPAEPTDDDIITVHLVMQGDPMPASTANGWNIMPPSVTAQYYHFTTEILVVGVDDDIRVNEFNLEQNYPNPFNPSTSINYTLAEAGDVSLRVFDVLGREVATLVNSTQNAGSYDITFDASDLASGLYIYTLKTGNFVSSKKMMLLK
jgi:hypothetical protein